MLTLNDGRNELWQWDTGRKLTVDADCSQVHFSNKVFGRSIDVDVADGVAIIPDILLQTDKDVTAWAFVGTAENGYTKISKVFKVNKRNKPADYVFTPQDQSTLGEILDRIEDLENRPSGDVSEEDIQNAVNEYLDSHPVSVNETDPTVPDWAKQPEPPKVKIPDTLPNPHKLTFSGAVNAEYDGGEAVEVVIPQGGGEVTDEQVSSAVAEWLEANKDAVSGGGRLVLDYIHDDSKMGYVIHITGYDAESKVWTTDGAVDLTTVSWSIKSQINLLDPLHKMTVDNVHTLLPSMCGDVTALSENTFTFSRTPQTTNFTPSDYVLVPNDAVRINGLPNVSRLRVVFSGQLDGATRYATFGTTQWFDPNAMTTVAHEFSYRQTEGIYNLIVCDFRIENGYIYGTTKQTFVGRAANGYAQGIYYPTAATKFPDMVISQHAYAGYPALPYMGRVRIYDMEGAPWVF